MAHGSRSSSDVHRLLERTLELPPAERVPFLSRTCEGDPALLERLQGVLEDSAAGVGPTTLAERAGLHREVLAELLAAVNQGEDTDSAIEPGSLLGEYEVLAKLGTGGMGEVYRARDTRLGREVALKVLPEHLSGDPQRLARFEREAKLLASLKHPHIAVIYGLEEHEGKPFLVLELEEGENLAEVLDDRGPLPVQQSLTIARQIAQALESAHAAGVIHRDLKPANVMLIPEGPGRAAAVRVLDFGLATERDDRKADDTVTLTAEGSILGTAPYMSPEQWRGDAVDQRSDLWAWGCLLFELLAGRPAFDAGTRSDIAVAVLSGEPDWSALPAELPVGVRALLGRCLEKDRGRRIGEAVEVRTALERLAAPSDEAWAPEARLEPLPLPGKTFRTPLVARDSEAAELRGHLDRAANGRGGLISLTGEPGIGKTRLSWDLIEHAQGQGFLALAGHCSEGEGSPPYAPWIEILESLVRQVSRSQLGWLLADGAPEIARLLPELRTLIPELPLPLDLPPEDSRRHLFRRLGELLDRLGRAQPVLILLEDLHWADSSSLMLLREVAPRLAEMPVMILATYRDTDVDVNQPLARVLEQLVRERLVHRIQVHRLPAQGVAELLTALSGEPPSASVTTAVSAATEGNPFFIEELVQQMAQSGAALSPEGRLDPQRLVEQIEISEGVRLVVGRRLGQLPETARRALAVAAVIGRRFEYELLESVSDIDGDRLLDLVEAAEQRHLIENDASSRREVRYQFAHELVRQTLLQGLSLPRRQRLHARIADALESLDPLRGERATAALAHHLYQAGTAVDEKRTVRALEQAAEQALAAGAHVEAERALSQALEVLSELDASDAISQQRLGLLRRLAPLQAIVGRYGEALVSYETLRDSLAEGDEPSDAAALAWVEMRMGRVQYEMGDYEGARATLDGASRRAEELGDRARIAACCQHLGDIDLSSGSLPKAIELYRRALEISEQAGNRRGIAASSTFLANALARAGRLAEAQASARRALALGEELGDERRVAWALIMLSQTYTYTGEYDEMRPVLERASEIVDRIGDYRGRAWLSSSSGFLLAAEGDYEAALAHYEVPLRMGLDSGGHQHEVTYTLAQTGEYLLRIGRGAEALERCRRNLEMTRRTGNKLESGHAYRVLAEIYACEEFRDREKADESLSQALEAFREVGAELDVARCHLLGARNARTFGSDGARRLAEQARADFERLGAHAWLQEANDFLEDLETGST